MNTKHRIAQIAQEKVYSDINELSEDVRFLSRFIQNDFSKFLDSPEVSSSGLRLDMQDFNEEANEITKRLNKSINSTNNILSYYIEKLEENGD